MLSFTEDGQIARTVRTGANLFDVLCKIYDEAFAQAMSEKKDTLTKSIEVQRGVNVYSKGDTNHVMIVSVDEFFMNLPLREVLTLSEKNLEELPSPRYSRRPKVGDKVYNIHLPNPEDEPGDFGDTMSARNCYAEGFPLEYLCSDCAEENYDYDNPNPECEECYGLSDEERVSERVAEKAIEYNYRKVRIKLPNTLYILTGTGNSEIYTVHLLESGGSKRIVPFAFSNVYDCGRMCVGELPNTFNAYTQPYQYMLENINAGVFQNQNTSDLSQNMEHIFSCIYQAPDGFYEVSDHVSDAMLSLSHSTPKDALKDLVFDWKSFDEAYNTRLGNQGSLSLPQTFNDALEKHLDMEQGTLKAVESLSWGNLIADLPDSLIKIMKGKTNDAPNS